MRDPELPIAWPSATAPLNSGTSRQRNGRVRWNVPIDVNLCGVDIANLLCDTNDDRESLVQFELGNVVHGEVGLLQSNGESFCRSFGEVDGVNASISPG
jgi:hypothetical protein